MLLELSPRKGQSIKETFILIKVDDNNERKHEKFEKGNIYLLVKTKNNCITTT